MMGEFRWGYRVNPQIMLRFKRTAGLLQHPPSLHMMLTCTTWGGPPLSLILMLQKPMLRFAYAECTGSDRFISKPARSSQSHSIYCGLAWTWTPQSQSTLKVVNNQPALKFIAMGTMFPYYFEQTAYHSVPVLMFSIFFVQCKVQLSEQWYSFIWFRYLSVTFVIIYYHVISYKILICGQ